jgi:2-C-methyl-D-erythritol 4-phosphate cytidylyltransferase
LIRRCYEAAMLMGTAVPAVNSHDSIRIETNGSNHAIDRDKVKIIQTPQTFRSEILKTAFRQEYLKSFTDESAVIEHSGIPIHLVEGEASNIKITVPLDLIIAEKMLL